jgi:hypothetical protein
MRTFILKLTLFLTPFSILLGFFIVLDPFRIVKNYEDYSENMFIIPNRDFVSTEIFLRNRQKYHYNAFILGSSRTVAFKTATWIRYLDSDSRPFVFDASGESIFGIYKKIEFIDRFNENIKNCLIILCTDSSFSRDSDHNGHLFIKHPSVAGTSWINFYSEFIKAYFEPKFLVSYYKYLLTHKYDSSMKRFIQDSKITYDPITNDIFLFEKDKEISANSVEYYKNRDNIFYNRHSKPIYAKPQISEKHLNMLRFIRDTFKHHHTIYKIVISPLYDQVQINPIDLSALREIFGSDNVFNLSGKNFITDHRENYYEDGHYRPVVGDLIIPDLYTNSNLSPEEKLAIIGTETAALDEGSN